MRFTSLGDSALLSTTVSDALGATIDEAPVLWTSDDPSVASVESTGWVRADGDGYAAGCDNCATVPNAFQRDIAQHLGKAYGFYIELDDRNYPFQVNPPEASAECAYTAIGQGVTYLNSFINRPFGTGVTSRPERWEHLAAEGDKIHKAFIHSYNYFKSRLE